jgi:hypothetical protein
VSFSEDQDNPYVSMRIDVLEGISHARKVCFYNADKVVQVIDTIQASDVAERNYTLLWHVPKDKKIEISDESVDVVAQDGKKMMITFKESRPDNISITSGIRNDRVFSCVSYKANSYEDSQVIRVLFRKRLGLHVCSEFKLFF